MTVICNVLPSRQSNYFHCSGGQWQKQHHLIFLIFPAPRLHLQSRWAYEGQKREKEQEKERERVEERRLTAGCGSAVGPVESAVERVSCGTGPWQACRGGTQGCRRTREGPWRGPVEACDLRGAFQASVGAQEQAGKNDYDALLVWYYGLFCVTVSIDSLFKMCTLPRHAIDLDVQRVEHCTVIITKGQKCSWTVSPN